MSKKISRRQCLVDIGGGSSVLMGADILYTLVASSVLSVLKVNSAQAATVEGYKSFIRFYVGQGAPGWYFLGHPGFRPEFHLFDSQGRWLGGKPEKLKLSRAHNASFATEFVRLPGQTGAVVPDVRMFRKNIAGKDVMLPSLYASGIVGASSSTPIADMSMILRNSITFRGVDMGGGGHDDRQRALEGITPTASSLCGVIAESHQGKTLIPAIFNSSNDQASLNISSAFRSHQGIGSFNIADMTRAIQKILGPVDSSTLPEFARHLDLKSGVDRVHRFMETQMGASLARDFSSAKDLMARDLSTTIQRWNQLKNKYMQIIQNAKGLNGGRSVIPFVSEAGPVTRLAGTEEEYQYNSGSQRFISVSDLRSIVNESAHIPNAAESFALAEILNVDLKNDHICGSLSLALLDPVLADGIAHSTDEHYAGVAISLIVNSWYYRAIGSCLYELIEQLKGAGQFNQTLICLASEFGRIPRTVNGKGYGSDHANTGGMFLLLSGSFPEPPQFTGHMRVGYDGGLSEYSGTWSGHDLPRGLLGRSGTLSYAYVASSILHVLGIRTPFNDPSLLRLNSSGFYEILFEGDNLL